MQNCDFKIKINPQVNSTATINLNFASEIIHESFFEFDTIMIDAKRIIEFFIKFLVVCKGEKVPKKFSVENFFLECCLPSSSQFIEKSNLYDEYCEYTDKKGIARLEENAFGRKIKNNRVYKVRRFQPMIDGKQVEAWKGIMLQNKTDKVVF